MTHYDETGSTYRAGWEARRLAALDAANALIAERFPNLAPHRRAALAWLNNEAQPDSLADRYFEHFDRPADRDEDTAEDLARWAADHGADEWRNYRTDFDAVPDVTGAQLDVRDYVRGELTTLDVVADDEHRRLMARPQHRPERSACVRVVEAWTAWDGIPESNAAMTYTTETAARGFLLDEVHAAAGTVAGRIDRARYLGRVEHGGGTLHPTIAVGISVEVIVSTAVGENIHEATTSDEGIAVGIYRSGEHVATVTRDRLNAETIAAALDEALAAI